ncbi:hypothetical protein [Delftia tsuruhatensis]|uniref:hypothetical protein n=1 Tax=Delftia tsuruhatensis TaxID=180282 RepID=UPI0030CBCE0A
MILDREFQLQILRRYAEVYPSRTFEKWRALDEDERKVSANLFYLQDHGLVEIVGQLSQEGSLIYQGGHITAKGMDFLADDGGLSAILGVVTIKLHDDTIKALIEGRILKSDLPEPEKKRFLAQLRELPAETTKHLVLKLVDLGLDKAPTAIETIGTFLKNL